MNTVILGAGFTGLAAAYKTGGTIYEASDEPGGICRSYYHEGYRFEHGGGHWIFGATPLVLNFLSRFDDLKCYQRDAGVYINKIFPYPIQGYFNPSSVPDTGTMKEWLLNQFGNDQCELFFNPFHEKYTRGLYEHIAPQDPQKSPTNNKGYNSVFYYPIHGLDTVIDKIAKDCDIKYDHVVEDINPTLKTISFMNGKKIRYDRLISTIPLDEMADCLDMTCELPFTNTFVLNIGGTPGVNLPKEHWLYIPYSDNGFYRVGFYSNVDPSFAPRGKVSIYVESTRYHDEDKVIDELQRWGFIEEVDITSEDEIELGYTWQYPENLTKQDTLEKIKLYGIEQIGRYGKWHFQGIAESIKDGLSC